MLFLALLLAIACLAAPAGAQCASCSELNREPIGFCACGTCVAGHQEWLASGAVQPACLPVDVCAANPGTRWDMVTQSCRACPTSFLTADCQPCDATDCLACFVTEKYDALGTGCVARNVPPGPVSVQIEPESATRDLAQVSVSSLTAITTADDWPTMLVLLAADGRVVPDSGGRVMGANGRLWPAVQYALAVRCGFGHYAPSYLGPGAINMPCNLLMCPAGTYDDDSSGLTPCRRWAV